MSTALLSIHDAYVTFGNKALFEDLSFNINNGDKICLVGKNGAGKTTLMHMITGTRELDGGTRWQQPGITVGYLHQDARGSSGQTVFDYIFSGLKEEKRNDDYKYMVDIVAEPLELDKYAIVDNLSGGQMRRAALARALVEEPDILLLDEPTNHLDLTAIEWLEEYLKGYRGTLLCVSHDRTFLANISDKIFWLDRGHIRVCPKGFGHFEEWSQMLLEQEARELARREKIVEQELEWASRGVKARRKRNMRRLADVKIARDKLKADKSLFNKTMSKVELEPIEASQVSKIVAEFIKVGKVFKHGDKETPILEKFNLRIMRGDRIGILGRNGSGKSTFLKLLVGQLEPDSGKVKLAKTAEISYFDQNRSDLDPDETLWSTLCPNGGDYVNVNGKERHVCGYLKDFMFDPKNAKDKVGTLSGGQKNRLMLAKVLANPGNLLILDEPTNDLDMDTLDMLEEILAQYQGTLIVVSHDRDFLDQTITKVLAFEGNANVEGCIGGYSDYLEKIGRIAPKPTKKEIKPEPKPVQQEQKQKSAKLSYKQKYDLEHLPEKISDLEKEIANLHHIMADPNLYTKNPEEFDKVSRRINKVEQELEKAENYWLELSELTGE